MGEGPRIWTVSDMVRHAKDVLQQDGSLRSVFLQGEVSNFIAHSSGHWYFTVKDKGAALSAVMFKGPNRKVSFEVKDGTLVRLFGSISVWEPRGQMQFVVESIHRAGIGEILERINELKERLRKEGLFDRPRKPIPRHPAAVAVVTSQDGAALRDIIKVMRKRAAHVDILLSPCQVQGDSAPTSIVRALRLADMSRADAVIVGRGGGSFEDLLPFQAEEVVRAVSSMSKPVISAVGHQTDHVMTDDAADSRAATPTEAAEAVAREAEAIMQEMDAMRDSMRSCAESSISDAGLELARCKPLLDSRRFSARVDAEKGKAEAMHRTIRDALRLRLSAYEAELSATASALSTMEPRSTLGRGYAIAETVEGSPVASVADLSVGKPYTLRFKDGRAVSRVESKEDER